LECDILCTHLSCGKKEDPTTTAQLAISRKKASVKPASWRKASFMEKRFYVRRCHPSKSISFFPLTFEMSSEEALP
jgi:hypothetical protein